MTLPGWIALSAAVLVILFLLLVITVLVAVIKILKREITDAKEALTKTSDILASSRIAQTGPERRPWAER